MYPEKAYVKITGKNERHTPETLVEYVKTMSEITGHPITQEMYAWFKLYWSRDEIQNIRQLLPMIKDKDFIEEVGVANNEFILGICLDEIFEF